MDSETFILSEKVIGQPLRVRPVKIIIDVIGLAVWIALLIGLFATTIGRNAPKATLLIAVVPVFFAGMSIRDLLNHMRASRITIREGGIEIRDPIGKRWFMEWPTIKRTVERRKFSGGLRLYDHTGRSVSIPFVVESYRGIREYIVWRTAAKRDNGRSQGSAES